MTSSQSDACKPVALAGSVVTLVIKDLVGSVSVDDAQRSSSWSSAQLSAGVVISSSPLLVDFGICHSCGPM